MKKQTIVLLSSILVSMILFSCKPKSIQTEENNLSKKYYLLSDTSKGALSVNLQVEIPVNFSKHKVLEKIRNTIVNELFGEKYITVSNDSLLEQFANDLAIEYKQNNSDVFDNFLDSTNLYSFNNDHTLSGFSLLSDKKIYVYGVERYIFMGGAHGYGSRNFYNFDLSTGKKITEADIFIANYKNVLTQLIKARILEDAISIKQPKNSESLLTLEDTDLWIDSIKPNGNFYITDISINYVFNPYEIGPYYLGQTEVILPFDRIKAVIKPNSAIHYLTKKNS